MTYEQKLKWSEMERLLPMLVKSVEKRKKVMNSFKEVSSQHKSNNKEYEDKLKEMVREVETEAKYFKKIGEVVKGIKIGRRQITTKEAEGLLYLIWITKFSVTDFFDEYEYIPTVIISKIEKKYKGVSFYDANFEEIFEIPGFKTIMLIAGNPIVFTTLEDGE